MAVSIAVDKLRIIVPAAVLIAVVVAMVPGVAVLLAPRGAPPAAAAPSPPALESTPAALPLSFTMVAGGLPPPGPNQKRSGACDAEAAQVEINGGCWMKTDKPPPCPRGKLWEHEGRCWIPVAEAKPLPTSGEPRTAGVAGP